MQFIVATLKTKTASDFWLAGNEVQTRSMRVINDAPYNHHTTLVTLFEPDKIEKQQDKRDS